MKALITGGAGFIGSHLGEHLVAQGYQVHVLDDLSTGSARNLDSLKAKPGFSYTIDSVLNVPLSAELVDRCDVVYHLAAAVGVKLIVESPVRTIETNIKGTEVILELAAKKNRKVVLASTSEVYGKANKVPFAENDDLVIGPTTKSRWSYACSKTIDEFLALAYWREKQVPVVIARLFNTVGPRQVGRYGMVLPTFVNQALAGQPLSVFGDGNQSRCFCHVSDVVRAMADLAESEDAIGEVFNIGSQEEVPILELAKRVKQLAGSDSPIQFIPYEQAYEAGFEDMQRRVPDLQKIGRTIGYHPSMHLDQIIESVIAYQRTQ